MPDVSTEDNPSIEEILRTIREVIAGEMTESTQTTTQDDVLELTDMVTDDGSVVNLKAEESMGGDVLEHIDNALKTDPSEAAAPPPLPTEPEAPAAEEIPAPEPVVTPAPEPPVSPSPLPPTQEQPAEVSAPQKKGLISEASANASSDALKMLLKTVSKTHDDDSPLFRSGTTLEDLVIEILKPQLANWLDQNLPSMVKQIVEKEIQKLIPKDDE